MIKYGYTIIARIDKGEEILEQINFTEEKDLMNVKNLNTNEEKVKYLRILRRYTQEKTAEMIGISLRQVQRIDKKLKNVIKMS